eukprot:Skav221666  [mRNA]  locus=scaffold1750:282478:284285:- [translate_table: standard]
MDLVGIAAWMGDITRCWWIVIVQADHTQGDVILLTSHCEGDHCLFRHLVDLHRHVRDPQGIQNRFHNLVSV